MKRIIKQVAVLGSGIMGSRIACHFANIGVKVLLLDVAPGNLNEAEAKKGLKITDKEVRNRIVSASLQQAISSKPSPLYKREFSGLIETGNFDDNLGEISSADWIIEAIIEDLTIKNVLFTKVDTLRRLGTLITTNTSGIPINFLKENKSDDFRKNFCGTHFFNPPRYLPLLEIIPSNETDHNVIEFLIHFGDLFLGKSTVLCKDTPAFIGNRIGLFSIMSVFHIMDKMDLSVDEIDLLTGPLIGRPKSATLRTCDLVGLDTIIKVADFLYQNCPEDNHREIFQLPDFVKKLSQNKWFGDKSGQGFFKKTKNEKGESEIESLNIKTYKYQRRQKIKIPSLEMIRNEDDLNIRLKSLITLKDRAGSYYRASFFALFQYVSEKIPEITNDLYKLDETMKSGFGWKSGPFEMWEALGLSETVKMMEKEGKEPAPWIYDMLKSGVTSFYSQVVDVTKYFDISNKGYKVIPGTESYILLKDFRNKVIWKNSGCSLMDLGDGILNLEFHTKMNTIGGEIVEGIQKGLDIAEKEYNGMIISNEGENFSVGANLALLLMYAAEQEFDEIDVMVRIFQQLLMRIKCATIPVVVAPHGMALGGGCEMCLQCTKVQVLAETYTGLVEFGAGLIPGGGGTKEFTLRASDEYIRDGIELPVLKERFFTIGMAKVSTSADEAFDLGIFRKGIDRITYNRKRLIADAKKLTLELHTAGFVPAVPRKDIKVLGQTGLGFCLAGIENMKAGNFITDYESKIAKKLAYVMCGGDLSQPTNVSEQYILDLEREAFLSLCGEKKTLERIQHLLHTGKPLRN